MANWICLGVTSEIPAGGCKVYDAGASKVAIFHVEGAYHAIDNICAHMGGPLGEGEIEGPIVTCPWHHWSYDVRTGRTTMSETVGVKKYPVEVRGEQIFVDVA